MMHERGKSDAAVVAEKPANKVAQASAESVERRAVTKGNVRRPLTQRTLSRARVTQRPNAYGEAGWRTRQTRGKSRMRERPHVRICAGARGNSRPYRDPLGS